MTDKKKLSGGKLPSVAAMNTFLYGEPDPDMPRISQEIKYSIKAAMPKIKSAGTIIIAGTGGDVDGKNDFRKLWEDKL